MDGACRCLAYAHLVCESLWLDFVTSAHRDSVGVVSWHMVRLAQCAGLRVSYMSTLSPSQIPLDGREVAATASKKDKIRRYLEATRQNVPLDDIVAAGPGGASSEQEAGCAAVHGNGVSKRNKFLNSLMETSVPCTEAIAIWILVLTNVYRVHTCSSSHSAHLGVEGTGSSEAEGGQPDSSNATDKDGRFTTRAVLSEEALKEGKKKQLAVLTKAARELIICTRNIGDMETAIAIIKGVAMLNYHFPKRSDTEDEDGFVRGLEEDGSDGTEVRRG